MNIQYKNNILYKTFGIFFLLNGAFRIVRQVCNGLPLPDFDGQWALCAYALRRIDALALIGRPVAAIEEIGSISKDFSTTPWGLLLGNLFYPGYLSINYAKIYFVGFSIILLLISTWFLYNRYVDNKELALFILLTSVTSSNFINALYSGNAGGMICCLLIIAYCICETKPYLAGICLGFAMVKPQVALLFCLVFLLEQKYKTIITAIVTVVGGWLASAALVGNSPLRLLQEFLGAQTGGEDAYFGMFSLLGYMTGNNRMFMYLSMLVGILLVLIVYVRFRNVHGMTVFVAASTVTTFWCYTWKSDQHILMIPIVICLYLMLAGNTCLEILFWFSGTVYCYNRSAIITVIERFLYIIKFPQMVYDTWLNRTATVIYAIGLIVLTIIIYKRMSSGDKKGMAL